MARRIQRIAVVDDDTDVLRAIERLLRVSGYEVRVYSSGEAFLSSIDTSAPDCLVLDLHMPEVSGFEVQSRLAARHSQVPVVVITGHDSEAAYTRAMECGACAYLCKPVDGDAIVSAIERAIAGPPVGPTAAPLP